MRPTTWVRAMLVAVLLLALVGAVDTARDHDWDVVVLFGAIGAVVLVLALRTTAARPLLPVRADLVAWLARRAAITGDRTEALADRAIAAYRDGLSGEEQGTGAAHER